ncbi:MAG: 2,4'-dihydroxyacetophenone dioxygenase family protein [Pseudomonadales bacterium]|nr:2,4'-dihydroxyacetophenone dioxygenase family protein [Pseudomonadales bacterium]
MSTQETPPVIPLHGLTEAIHISETDVPFVETGNGSSMQLLQVDLNQGLWVVKTRMPGGQAVNKHYHTGSVFAVTIQGQWFYKEYPEYINSPGSYLFEPAGSVHTLMTPEDQEGITETWFAIYGANVNVDEEGNVTSMVDAQSILATYRALCEAQGLSSDKVIVNGEQAAS